MASITVQVRRFLMIVDRPIPYPLAMWGMSVEPVIDAGTKMLSGRSELALTWGMSDRQSPSVNPPCFRALACVHKGLICS